MGERADFRGSAPSWKTECRDKRRFVSEKIARAAAKKTRELSNEHMHPYRCRICRHWHIGH